MSKEVSHSSELAAGLMLLMATVAALAAANSPLAEVYKDVFALPFSFGWGEIQFADTIKGWIKNGLMSVFFLQVGLEIKAECREGVLRERRTAMLPLFGAIGGILAPAALYMLLAGHDAARGWAIPSATDIAFALCVVSLLGARVPAVLRLMLLAIAVIDDLAAIVIIAVFYTEALNLTGLGLAVVCVGLLALLNARAVGRLWPFLAAGFLLWLCALHSGINPTLAGVVTALFIPMPLLHGLFARLAGPVGFVIMPLFAFASAGVAMKGLTVGDMAQPVTAGIIFGLVLGKPLGITLTIWGLVKSGAAELPRGLNFRHITGLGFLAGIGFTMSLFIASLAFGESAAMEQAKLGVLAASLLSALFGSAWLVFVARGRIPG